MNTCWILLNPVIHHKSRIGSVLLVVLVLAMAASNAPAAQGAAIVVNTTTDEDTNGDGLCSLREAMVAANSNWGYNGCTAGSNTSEDTITFSVNGTITLVNSLSVTTSSVGLTIDGAGRSITIDGNGTSELSRSSQVRN